MVPGPPDFERGKATDLKLNSWNAFSSWKHFGARRDTSPLHDGIVQTNRVAFAAVGGLNDLAGNGLTCAICAVSQAQRTAGVLKSRSHRPNVFGIERGIDQIWIDRHPGLLRLAGRVIVPLRSGR